MAGPDTIIALSSGRLPAAIAIVRASGPGALALARSLASELPAARHAAVRRFVDPHSGEEIDRGLLLLFPGPASATGEDLVEFHLHGSRAVVDALLAAATRQAGVRMAEPGEFTRRALANGRVDLIEAEGLAELLAAETRLQHRAAQSRAGGAVSAQLEQWRQRLLAIAATAEIAIDYADEEDGVGAPSIATPATALAEKIAAELSAPPVDAIRDGLRVVLAGEPNVGKSSLLNALSDSSRAIVTPVPGTTRDSIEVPLAFAGLPIILVDTAGIRSTADEVEQQGVERASREIERADLILWLGSSGLPPGNDASRRLMVASKADEVPPPPGRIAVSSLTGDGLPALWEAIVTALSDKVPPVQALALTRRESDLLRSVCECLNAAADADDPILGAEEIRLALQTFDRLTGRVGVEDLLETLFGRFCVGK